MTLRVEISPDQESLQELPEVGPEDLEEYVSSLLTCGVRFSINGQPLTRQIPESWKKYGKLDSDGFHGILCIEFLADLLRATIALNQGAIEETVYLAASLYSLIFQKDDDGFKVTVEDGGVLSYYLGEFSFREFKVAVSTAVRLTLDNLVQARRDIDLLDQITKVKEGIRYLQD